MRDSFGFFYAHVPMQSMAACLGFNGSLLGNVINFASKS